MSQPWPHDQGNRPRRSSNRMFVKALAITAGIAAAIAVYVVVGIALWKKSEDGPGLFGGFGPEEISDRYWEEEPGYGPEARAQSEFPFPKYRAIAAAYNSTSVDVDAAELQRIEALIDALVLAMDEDDETTFARYVDRRRYAVAVKNSGCLTGATTSDYPDEVVAWAQVVLPTRVTRYRIAQVVPITGGNEAIVYGYFWDDDDGSMLRIRWWIIRNGDGWLAYDWELIDYGMRDSTETALLCAGSSEYEVAEYNRAAWDISRADDLIAAGDFGGAADAIRRAESRSAPPELVAVSTLLAAYAWTRCDRYAEALRLYRGMPPQEAPGWLIGQALAYDATSNRAKTLFYAREYEMLVGYGPTVGELKAECLADGEHYQEAAAEYRRMLAIDPNDYQALTFLGRHHSGDRQAMLTGYVRQTEDPGEMAESLARYFFSRDDGIAAAMVQLVREYGADDLQMAFLTAQWKEAQGQIEEAATAYRDAISRQTDPQERAWYVGRFLGMMTEEDRVVEGYRAVPDPIEAFRYFAVDLEYGDEGEAPLDDEQMKQLIEVHGAGHPDDPLIFQVIGDRFEQEGKYEEAARQFALGEKKTTDEDLLQSLRRRRVAAMMRAGQDGQAYRSVLPADEAFRLLAGLYRMKEDVDRLEQLIVAHRAARPDDPWLNYYQALVHVNRQEYDEADRLFALAGDDEQVANSSRYARCDAQYEAGRSEAVLLEACTSTADADDVDDALRQAKETFETFARRLLYAEKWDELDRLLDAVDRRFLWADSTVYWRAEMLWAKEDHAGLVDLLQPWLRTTPDSLSCWEVDELREDLVRALLRLNRGTEAMRVAQRWYDADGSTSLLILAHAAAGNVRETVRLIRETSNAASQAGRLFSDADVGQIVRGDAFRPLRTAFPPPLHAMRNTQSIVLLLKQPETLDAAALKKRLRDTPDTGGGETEIVMLPADDLATEPSWIVRTGGESFGMTFGNDPYQVVAHNDLDSLKSDVLRRAVLDHQGWIAVDLIDRTTPGSDDRFAQLCHFVAPLIDDRCLGVYFWDEDLLLAATTETRDLLRKESPRAKILAAAESVYMLREIEPDRDRQKAIEACRRRLPELVAALANRRDGQTFAVAFRLTVGHVSRDAWLSLNRIAWSTYGAQRYLGHLTDDAIHLPALRSGEPLSLASYEITNWKITDGDETAWGIPPRQ